MCIFRKKGNYTENDEHDVLTFSRTKSLGEPDNCTIIRTSIIGEEVNQRSLIEWIKLQAGKNADGYLNHIWNGLTCLELAKVIENIIKKQNFWNGIKHIHSPNAVNKNDLFCMTNEIFDLNIKINPINTKHSIDRSLKSIFNISNLI